jgi:hypothetical protein
MLNKPKDTLKLIVRDMLDLFPELRKPIFLGLINIPKELNDRIEQLTDVQAKEAVRRLESRLTLNALSVSAR